MQRDNVSDASTESGRRVKGVVHEPLGASIETVEAAIGSDPQVAGAIFKKSGDVIDRQAVRVIRTGTITRECLAASIETIQP